MPHHPAEDREWISGQGFYRNPPQWSVRRSAGRLEVIPDFRKLIIAASTGCAFAAAVGFLFVWSRSNVWLSGAVVLFAVIPLEAMLIGALTAALRDQRKGPYLTFDLPSG